MYICEVKGGNKFQRELAHSVIGYCVQELLPALRKIDITVHIQSLKPLHRTLGSELYATCEQADHREYLIKIDRNTDPNTFVTYLCHEMVHVMQYATGMLKDCYLHHRQDVVVWQGKQCLEGNYSYPEQPWEKQAFDMQETLAVGFFCAMGVSENQKQHGSYQEIHNIIGT